MLSIVLLEYSRSLLPLYEMQKARVVVGRGRVLGPGVRAPRAPRRAGRARRQLVPHRAHRAAHLHTLHTHTPKLRQYLLKLRH